MLSQPKSVMLDVAIVRNYFDIFSSFGLAVDRQASSVVSHKRDRER